MAGDREALSIPSFDEMDDFAPRSDRMQRDRGQEGRVEPAPAPQPVPRAADTRRAIDAVSQFPSREAASDGQLNLKGPRTVLDRFRKLCRDDRRAYYDMLEILMDSFEQRQGGDV